MFDLTQIIPLALGAVSLVAIASDPYAPCGNEAKQQAETITDHLRAVANHARAVVVLIVRKTGAAGDQ
ncbi:hypothetical protein [Streptomyces neyagawaensis]|uniref:hypothetical protein n=1 Tax=Streptomyces neyagawaensis TaxID=42238 RepID=UPI00201CBEC5|nr:hypothetical protein [Streptomyces neyagawaensis]MCL6737399.1 hypothetical protein [Streptomyces neyagawaensis]